MGRREAEGGRKEGGVGNKRRGRRVGLWGGEIDRERGRAREVEEWV